MKITGESYFSSFPDADSYGRYTVTLLIKDDAFKRKLDEWTEKSYVKGTRKYQCYKQFPDGLIKVSFKSKVPIESNVTELQDSELVEVEFKAFSYNYEGRSGVSLKLIGVQSLGFDDGDYDEEPGGINIYELPF